MTLPLRLRIQGAGILLLLACLPAWWSDRAAFLAAWLAAWCFCAGIAMGGLVIVWMHTLTGGGWGRPLRAPLLEAARLLPWLALLFVPLLAGLDRLYPWATHGDWAHELTEPAFKRAWLQPGFFAARAVGVLLLWNALAWASRRLRIGATAGFAAFALIAYGLSAGIAAVDWIMSLTPLWYSSIFGIEVAVGQALAGMAIAALVVCLPGTAAGARRDVGNLLFAFVLMWGYVAFAQFLIIWSENLPHEIVWYEQRRSAHWLALGVAMAIGQFVAPFFLLLFRSVKDSSSRLAAVAIGLLAAHLLELWWLIVPSVNAHFGLRELWLLPVMTAGLVAFCYGALPVARTRHA